MSARRPVAALLVTLVTSVAAPLGCTAAPPQEYSAEEAVSAGIYPTRARWTVTRTTAAERTLRQVIRHHPPEPTPISGLGIVVGLSRTGDSGAALGQLLAYWQQQVAEGTLGMVDPPTRAGSAALVVVEAELPIDGRPGPAWVRPAGNARSLVGGRLLTTALRGSGIVMATAEGALITTQVDADGKATQDPKKGRAPRLTPRRRPDARRLEFSVNPTLPGTEPAVMDHLRTRFPNAKVWVDQGPPRRLFVALPTPITAEDLDALKGDRIRIPVGRPGVIIVRGGGDQPESVELLGPPIALGLANLRISFTALEDSQDFVRVVGVPKWRDQDYRRAIVEFATLDLRRVRVICSNQLDTLLPVVDRTGIPLRNVAAALGQAHDAGALPATLVVQWADSSGGDRAGPDGPKGSKSPPKGQVPGGKGR